MSTILTDDERPELPPTNTVPRDYFTADQMEAYADAREAAVLAKLAQQWPVGFIHPQEVPRLENGETVAFRKVPYIGERQIPVFLRPVPQQADRQRVPTIEELTEKIASMLHGTYHCSRVWEAWNVGTMSEEDFGQVDESDTPAEIAAEIHAMLAAAPEAPAQRKKVGDSRFESWFSEDFDPKNKGTKQQMREAYEAGMNDDAPEAPAQASAVDEREAFEAWLGIKPCGAAHEFAWASWKARAALAQKVQA